MILASYIHQDKHVIVFKRTDDGHKAICDTCSLPATVAAAVAFMYGHNVRSLVIDGCTISRI